MSRRKIFEKIISDWSTDQRIKIAKERTRLLTDRVLDVIDMHAANEIIQYSDTLSRQIPLSYAGHAHSTFQNAFFQFEIIGLVGLWDKPEENSVSIPTVAALIDNKKVISNLSNEIYQVHANSWVRHLSSHMDAEKKSILEESIAASQREFAHEQSVEARKVLTKCIRDTKETIAKQQMTSVRNLRDHISHSVTETRREQSEQVQAVKYGDEKALLFTSIEIIENLYCWVNGTSFDIKDDCFLIARKRAHELWDNCTFDIPSRKV